MMRALRERFEPDLGELEPAYRQRYLRADATQAQLFALMALVAQLLFVPVDIAMFRERPPMLAAMLGLRGLALLVCVAFLLTMRRIARPAAYDRLVLAFLIGLAALQGISASTRPLTYYGSFVFDLILILCCYLVVPNSPGRRAAAALAASASSLAILLLAREPNLLYLTSVPVAMLGAHLIGVISSARTYGYRRQEFRAIHEAQQLNERLRVLAETDALTGALNRRRFMELGEEELRRHRRYGRPFALLLADVDHFKRVNDRHGHAAGDAVLRAVAAQLQQARRTTDSVGRLGGEEFALLLPETDLPSALVVAERMRQLVQEGAAEAEGGPVSVTISAGVAEVAAADASFDDLLRRADQLLYRAKDMGRNRVEA